ncbi:MAG: hypothetical protein AB1637_00120 [Elusimicrobiota bacterium]
MLEKEDILDSKFSAHDRHRLEVKLDLEFQKDKKSLYNIEYYFFLPQSLNISQESYSKEQFYAGTQHYIRFKTPDISMEKLFMPANELSPFNKAMKVLDEISSGISGSFLEETAVDEMKLLGSIIRANLRDAVEYISKTSGHILQNQRAELLMREIRLTQEALSSLKEKVISSGVSQKIKDTFFALDEYISLMIGEYLTDLIKLRQDKKCEFEEDLVKEMQAIVLAQRNYRKAMGYSSVLKNGGINDHFLYWRGLLKKFISSALYLNPQLSDLNLLTHTGPAIAAGLAMLFAIIVTIYAQSKYAINSAAFVIIIVLSYIFKDRIKDWLKIIFSKKMTAWLYDRKTNVTEPAHNSRIGYIKETFSYIPAGLLPEDIKKIRKSDNKKSIEEEAKTERVFKYKREIFLNFEKIEKYHKRRKTLIDILRFSIADFIKHADEEIVPYDYFDEKTNSVVEEKCSRLYHINLVIRYNTKERKTYYYERLRIIATKNGIYSLQEVK